LILQYYFPRFRYRVPNIGKMQIGVSGAGAAVCDHERRSLGIPESFIVDGDAGRLNVSPICSSAA
jgi:hypothetical protein